MKSWSDIEQSKKLVEILPLESADMYYSNDNTIYAKVIKECDITCAKVLYGSYDIRSFDVCGNTPCWSLSALLDILESELDGENGETYQLHIEKDGTWWDISYDEVHNEANPIEVAAGEELVDVAVEMILRLNKLKQL